MEPAASSWSIPRSLKARQNPKKREAYLLGPLRQPDFSLSWPRRQQGSVSTKPLSGRLWRHFFLSALTMNLVFKNLNNLSMRDGVIHFLPENISLTKAVTPPGSGRFGRNSGFTLEKDTETNLMGACAQ